MKNLSKTLKLIEDKISYFESMIAKNHDISSCKIT